MKLYEAVYVIKAVVVAENIESAHVAAQSAWNEVKNDQEPFTEIGAITLLSDLPDDWDEQCSPYGAPAIDKRIKDYLP